ncbi:MAG: M20/M25/M40 family metallo-hydrolase, partial [Defluviicoccus sp.]|nr:M20/M25/M40 family metallo-hydrolase [Defluviicoccus sp.]
CDRIADERRVMFNFDRRVDAPPAVMDRRWVDKLLAHARALSLPERTILSGAGHDAALFAAAGIPSAMIFIRNHNGSHNPNEAMDIDDFLKGADLLYRALMDPP